MGWRGEGQRRHPTDPAELTPPGPPSEPFWKNGEKPFSAAVLFCVATTSRCWAQLCQPSLERAAVLEPVQNHAPSLPGHTAQLNT